MGTKKRLLEESVFFILMPNLSKYDEKSPVLVCRDWAVVHTTQGGARSVAVFTPLISMRARTPRVMGGACDGGMRCARLVGVAWVHCGCWLCQCLVAGCEYLSRYGTNLHTVRNDAGKSGEDLQEAGPDPGEGVKAHEEAGPD